MTIGAGYPGKEFSLILKKTKTHKRFSVIYLDLGSDPLQFTLLSVRRVTVIKSPHLSMCFT